MSVFERITGRRAVASFLVWVWLALTVWLAPALARAQGGATAVPEPSGSHYIVLIDDSYDARSLSRSLPSVLPAYLYSKGQTDLPPFRPGRDELTLSFFTIHHDGAPSECKIARRYSALPEHMFQVVATPAAAVRTAQGFRALLQRSLELPCRHGGNLSPIVTAQSLILPYLAGKLPAGSQYSRVFVILAHNGKFNASTSPARELREWVNDRDINRGIFLQGIEKAEDLLQREAGFFRFAQLRAGYESSGLYLDAFEVQPLVPPAQLQVWRPEELVLDRVAVSSRELRVRPQTASLAELRIALPDPASNDGKLVPLQLSWRFVAEDGGPWSVGDKTFPTSEQVLDLRGCPPPCRKEKGHLAVPILALGGEEPRLSRSDDVPQGTGKLLYRVGFRYDAGVSYSHLYRDTTQEVALPLAPAEIVPGGLFSNDVVIDNALLASRWRRQDQEAPAGGLSQAAARDRLLRQRNWIYLQYLLLAIVVAVAAMGAVLFYLYQTAYHRPFRPVLEWSPAGEVMIDFGRLDSSRLLVGTLTVRNPEPVPWFGQRLRNREQPTRHAQLAVSFQPLESLGLQTRGGGTPIGFLGSGTEEGGADLAAEVGEAVSDGKRLFVFLAGEVIRDLYGRSADEEGAAIPVELGIRMEWRAGDVPEGAAEAVDTAVQFVLRVQPEEPRPPHVELLPAQAAKLFFRKGKAIEAGCFAFTSRAGHSFARPFLGEYLLKASRENFPLGGEPLRLARPRLVLPAGARVEIPVLLECDGKVVPNPDPEVQSYEFRLMGPRDADSEPGPHRVLLYRDPTRAEIELRVTYLGETREIFWPADGSVKWRLIDSADGTASPAVEIREGILDLERLFKLPFGEAHPAINVLTLRVGNSATNDQGRGVVEVTAIPRLVLAPGAQDVVHLRRGWDLGDLLRLYRLDEPVEGLAPGAPQFRVRDGGSPQILDLKIEPGHIERIDGAVIEAGKCHAEVSLQVLVRDDRGRESKRALRLRLPLELERLPGSNWLCIDFGTSAIAVAVGSGVHDSFKMVPLQDVPVRQDGSSGYGKEDEVNPEAGTPFLPSWVICNADLRSEASGQQDGWRAGFPLFRPASLRPGEASFLGLPAITSQLGDRNTSGRVIFSLKSWLGKGAREIPLQEEVRFLRNGHEVRERMLPLEAVVESGFGALATTYLHQQRAEQIVLCHPNTFTERHRERLHAIACRALMKTFKISSPRHIRLLSESDAVAYYYCSQRMRRNPRGGTERILVYDLGAGTLDVSILKVEWNNDPFFPRTWKVEGRMGVPVAGNHLDEVLARIVDEQLQDPTVVGGPVVQYAFPVVAELPGSGELNPKYRDAVHQLHRDLKDAKHRWDGSSPFVVRVGGTVGGDWVISYDSREGQVSAQVDPGQNGIFLRERELFLSVSAARLRKHPRLEEYLDFVAGTVVDEALLAAGLRPDEIDTLIISGRGALWPGLRDRVAARLPRAEVPDWSSSGVTMKEAVVHGAIARQELSRLTEESSVAEGRLGILLAGDTHLVPEEQWSPSPRDPRPPIDLTASPKFRLVQVAVRNPDRLPVSLRRHFYIDLSAQLYLREMLWRDDPRLWVEKLQIDGRTITALRNFSGQEIRDTGNAGTPIVTTPPWPVGQLLLDPKG